MGKGIGLHTLLALHQQHSLGMTLTAAGQKKICLVMLSLVDGSAYNKTTIHNSGLKNRRYKISSSAEDMKLAGYWREIAHLNI